MENIENFFAGYDPFECNKKIQQQNFLNSPAYGTASGSGTGWGSGMNSLNRMCYCSSGKYMKCGLVEYCDWIVYNLSFKPTIIEEVYNDSLAAGYLVKDDLTLEKCYIVKENGIFGHGATVEKAWKDLRRTKGDFNA